MKNPKPAILFSLKERTESLYSRVELGASMVDTLHNQCHWGRGSTGGHCEPLELSASCARQAFHMVCLCLNFPFNGRCRDTRRPMPSRRYSAAPGVGRKCTLDRWWYSTVLGKLGWLYRIVTDLWSHIDCLLHTLLSIVGRSVHNSVLVIRSSWVTVCGHGTGN